MNKLYDDNPDIRRRYEQYNSGMKYGKESKEDRFRRLAESRVNKIIAMMRLLGNLSCTNIYAYTRSQV